MKLFKVHTSQTVGRAYFVNADSPDKAAEKVMLGNVPHAAEGTTPEEIGEIYEVVPQAKEAAE